MKPEGSFPGSISHAKDVIDFWLTRFPRLYLYVERFRHWINWDKRLYLSLIKPGSIVIDIGAHTGTHTVMFSHLVGKSGRVLAFEPVPESFERLRETLRRRSRFSNVSIFRMAVGNPGPGPKETVIRIPGDDLTQASLKIQTDGAWRKTADTREHQCLITSIDAEMSEAPLPRLDFVKIDIEGGELDALKGAARTISKHCPFVYCEVYEKWTAAFGYTSGELFAFVRSLGYVGAMVIREGRMYALALDDYTMAGMFNESSNVLFFSEKHVQLVESFDKRLHIDGS
jgi:FkbM family methyltransferase